MNILSVNPWRVRRFTKQACQENVVASFFPLKIFIYIYNILQNLPCKTFMYTNSWQDLSTLNSRRTYIQGLQALKENVQRKQLWRHPLALSKYIFIYWCVQTLMHQNKLRVILIDKYYLLLRGHLILRKFIIILLMLFFIL